MLHVIVLICLWFSIVKLWLGVKLRRPGPSKKPLPGRMGKKKHSFIDVRTNGLCPLCGSDFTLQMYSI